MMLPRWRLGSGVCVLFLFVALKGEKKVGKLVEWNDRRGFGWIEVEGERVFAHIKEFEKGGARPGRGDAVSFRIGNDEKGRTRAEGIRMKRRTEPIGATRWLGCCLLLVLPLVAGWMLTIPGWVVPVVLLVMSAVTWMTYREDKRKAEGQEWRVSEETLHTMELLGGWPGAFLAQRRYRHKTSKGPFLFVFWVIVVLWQLVAMDVILGGALSGWVLDKIGGK